MPTFQFEGSTIVAEDGETVLSALVRHEVSVDYGCKAGACQRCLVCTNAGEAPKASTQNLDDSLIERGYFLACQAAAQSISEVWTPSDSAYPSHPATLTEREWLSPTVIRIRLETVGLAARRGQCIRLRSSCGVVRSYSIADRSTEGLELHVRLIPGGAMSEVLKALALGSALQVEGPFGKCTYKGNDGKPLLLIGSGTGLAPLWGVIQDAISAGHSARIALFHGAATSEGLYFRKELENLQQQGLIHYVSCADHVNDELDRLGSPLKHALSEFPDLEGWRVYLCGHPQLVRAAQKACFLAGASLGDIHADPFVDQSFVTETS
ncbi:MAG TPA: 2Fe-2S iron-sulfur cluster binding domain-containing protein [Fimbriimonadaceae bacterium]|nr:2Fe-2S iron-sulfur cluster binding domain-containing protein [Fimbriimonadaceae bacterium]